MSTNRHSSLITNNVIVATCPAGLCNRIKCMISTMKWAAMPTAKRCNDIDAKPYVYWPVNEQCGCNFEYLFSPYASIKEVTKIPPHSEINKSWKLINNDKELDFKYHKLSMDEIYEMIPFINLIKPREDIIDTTWAFINKYRHSFDEGEVIGVHIRKGDYKDLYDGRQHISTEDKFISEIKSLLRHSPNYKVLLCTEDEETENKFEEIFGKDTIIYFPKRFRGRDSPNSIKEAFVDMLLLSQCPIIIGTFLSTFTEMAWWFGGCKAKVIIPGEDDINAVDKVMAQLPKKGEWIHKKIWRKFKIWRG